MSSRGASRIGTASRIAASSSAPRHPSRGPDRAPASAVAKMTAPARRAEHGRHSGTRSMLSDRPSGRRRKRRRDDEQWPDRASRARDGRERSRASTLVEPVTEPGSRPRRRAGSARRAPAPHRWARTVPRPPSPPRRSAGGAHLEARGVRVSTMCRTSAANPRGGSGRTAPLRQLGRGGWRRSVIAPALRKVLDARTGARRR